MNEWRYLSNSSIIAMVGYVVLEYWKIWKYPGTNHMQISSIIAVIHTIVSLLLFFFLLLIILFLYSLTITFVVVCKISWNEWMNIYNRDRVCGCKAVLSVLQGVVPSCIFSLFHVLLICLLTIKFVEVFKNSCNKWWWWWW